MRKYLFILGMSVLLSAVSFGAVDAPRDTTGKALASVEFVGALPCGLNASTGTTMIQCGSAERAVVYGVIASSLPVTDYLVFRDTYNLVLSQGITIATAAVILANDGSLAQSNQPNATNPNTFLIKFPVPLQFLKGINVKASAAPTGQSQWTILYRPLDSDE